YDGNCFGIVDHRTPLQYAIEDRNPSLVRFLLAHGADVNRCGDGRTSLMCSVSTNMTELLLAHGAKINQKSDCGSALMEAARSNVGAVKCLLRHGADVSLRNDEGDTALHRAVEGEDKSIVRALLLAGANVNARNNRGETALDYAKQNSGMVRLLKRWG